MPEWPRDIREELRQHLDDHYRELRSRGASHDEAIRAIAPDVAALSGSRTPVAAGLLADIRYAGRTLRKSAAFCAVVIVTLALGIGANSAIFTVVNAVLLRPLPYDRDGRLAVIWGDLHKPGLEEIPASAAEYVDYRDRNRVFDAVAAYDTTAVNVTGLDRPERVAGAIVTATLFRMMGATPALGRAFTQDDERPGAHPVAIVSHAFWQQHLGSDTAVIGRALMVNDTQVDVVGVMPPAFNFPDETIAVWQPLAISPEDVSEDQRGSHSYTVIGRLRRGVTLAQAQSEMKALGDQIGAEHRTLYRAGFGAHVRSLRDEVVGDAGAALWTLMAAVALVLCIACVNVANLLLARSTARRRELAIRTALGATRVRVARQLLAESLVLSGTGGAVGLGFALAGVRALAAFAPENVPRLNELSIDARVVAVTAAAAMLTGLVFGLVPVLQIAVGHLSDTLKESGRAAAGGPARTRVRQTLVAAEVALSVVLLIAAALLMISFARVQEVAPGFRAAHLLTARVSVSPVKYGSLRAAQRFYNDLFTNLRRQPGIESAAAINAVPFSGRGGDRSLFIEGRTVAPGEPSPDEQVRFTTAGYFATMGIPIRGRDFSERDADSAPHVAVVNDAFARKYFPAGDALGQQIRFQQTTSNRYEIVGVSGNVRHRGLDGAEKPEVYVPVFQPLFDGFQMPAMDLVVRTTGDPLNAAPTLRAIVSRLDRDQPIAEVRTMDERIGRSLAPRRFNMVLLGLFAALAALLAAVGMSGVVAYTVAQRTQEIGVRLALGAQPRDVVALLVAQGMKPALAGLAIGLAAAAAAGRGIASLLFGVNPTDARTFAVVATALLIVAAIACWVPARRAMRVNPLDTLRAE